MKGIYLQKGSPYYWLRFYDKFAQNPKDKRRSVSTGIEVTAADWERWHEARAKGIKPDLKGTPELHRKLREFKAGMADRRMELTAGIKLVKEYTLQEGYDLFKDYVSVPGSKQELKDKTLDNYTRVVDNFIIAAGNKNLREYTTEDFYKFLRMYKGKSQNTRSIYTRTLHSLFNYFLKKEWISKNIIEKVDQEEIDPDPIPPNDMVKIINHLAENKNSPHHRQLIYFMLLTGCRPSSAMVQLKEDIDFTRKLITIRNVKSGKRKNKPNFKFPLYDELLSLIKEMGVEEGDSGRLFDMYAVVEKNYTWPLSFWDRAMDKLTAIQDKDGNKIKKQIAKKYKLKQIRPTLATFLINVLKKDIFLVKKLLDHANIKITEKHYIYFDLERIRKELNGVTLESFLQENTAEG